jgi:hypothetical protein
MRSTRRRCLRAGLERRKCAEGGRSAAKEVDLAAMEGVRLVTVRRALAELAHQGTIRVPKAGAHSSPFRASGREDEIAALRKHAGARFRSVLETRLLELRPNGVRGRGAALPFRTGHGLGGVPAELLTVCRPSLRSR